MASPARPEVCQQCNKPIGAGQSFVHVPPKAGETGPAGVHEQCVVVGVCAGCNGNISPSDGLLDALDTQWHPQCFKCSKCDSGIQGRYAAVDGKPLCGACVDEIKKQQAAGGGSGAGAAKVCCECGESVSGGGPVLQLGADLLHRKCLKCSICQCSLIGKEVYAVSGKRVCEGCAKSAASRPPADATPPSSSGESAATAAASDAAPKRPADLGPTDCVTCGKSVIGGQAVKVLGGVFHVQCLLCKQCKAPIQGGQMAAINNEPHCVPCYQKLKEEHEQKQRMAQQTQMQHNLEGRAAAAQAASSAGQEGPVVECSICKNNVRGKYQELNGVTYCMACAEVIQRSTKCSKCRKKIDPGVKFRRALGEFFHIECFVCFHCKCVLPEVFQEKDRKVYCDEHYTELFGEYKEKCPRCNEAITSGDVATHNGQAFHKECFTCQTCGKPFPDGAFMPAKDGTVHCKPCFFKHGGFT